MALSSNPIGAIAPNRANPLPLWAQVSDDLRRRIDSAEFNDSFPGEIDLTEQYGVSRHTIREALRVLRVEGLLKSERGRGTSVQKRPYAQNLGALYSLFHTIEVQGVSQTSQVLRQSLTTNPSVAAELGLAPDTEFVVLERIRFAADEPLAHDTCWLPAQKAGALLTSDFTTTSLYGELTRKCGIEMTGGREHIVSQSAPRHIAQALSLPPGSAVFFIERLGCSYENPVEWRETFIRGDRFSLNVDFTNSLNSLNSSHTLNSQLGRFTRKQGTS